MAPTATEDENMRSSSSRIANLSEAGHKSRKRQSNPSSCIPPLDMQTAIGITRSLSRRSVTSPQRGSEKSRWNRAPGDRKSPSRHRQDAPPRRSLSSSTGDIDGSPDLRDVSPPPATNPPACGSSSAPVAAVETTNAPAWAAVVRRVQAEEIAREAAVTDLAAYVEQAIVSITARVEAVVAFECRLEAVERITTTLSSKHKPIAELEESVQDIALRCEEFMLAHAASSREHEDALNDISKHFTEAFKEHVVQVRTATADFANSARGLGVRLDRLENEYRRLDEKVAGLMQDVTTEIQGRLLDNCRDVFGDPTSLEVPRLDSLGGETASSSLVELANAFETETSAIMVDTSAIIRASPRTPPPFGSRYLTSQTSQDTATRGAEAYNDADAIQMPFVFRGSNSSSRQPTPTWRLARASSEASLSAPQDSQWPTEAVSRRSASVPRQASPQALLTTPSIHQALQASSQPGVRSRGPSRAASPRGHSPPRLQVAQGAPIVTAPSRASRTMAAPPPLSSGQLHTAPIGQASSGWATPRSLAGSTASSNATAASGGGLPASQVNQFTMGLRHEALG